MKTESLSFDYNGLNAMFYICLKCDRVWNFGKYGFRCPGCGKEVFDEYKPVS